MNHRRDYCKNFKRKKKMDSIWLGQTNRVSIYSKTSKVPWHIISHDLLQASSYTEQQYEVTHIYRMLMTYWMKWSTTEAKTL